MNEEFDFVVIGGGSGGYAGARTAVDAGLRTAVVEGASELGGLCILRGCMPSKTLLESAKRYRAIRQAEEFGLSVTGLGFDVSKIIARKRSLISDFAGYRSQQLTDGRFDLVRGTAEFLSPNEIRITAADGTKSEIRAKAFLIATGSAQSVPDLPGLTKCGALTSDDLLDLETLPESMLVLGGGPVALEMASYCHAFGTEVTIIQRSAQILSGSDPDAAAALEKGLRHDGMTIFTGTAITGMESGDFGCRISFQHDGHACTVEGRAILNALGRHAVLPVGLPVALNKRQIAVSLTQQTSIPHIFAAGDVCSPLEVVHIAIQQGEVAARNAARLLGKASAPMEEMDYRLNLFGVFTEPGFASVGANEAELTALGRAYRCAKYDFDDHGKSLVMGETIGFVKILADEATGEILGASLVGPEASELIHEIVVAMRFRSTVHELATTPHYHPTLSEIWTYPAEELAAEIILANP